MKLNPGQQECVACATPLMVLAPPGSGKTGTLVAKTTAILKSDPRAVVGLVTFTDAAAKEIQERVSKALPGRDGRRVIARTFHSHGIEQLRAAGILGRILTPYESSAIVKEAAAEFPPVLDDNAPSPEAFLQEVKSRPEFTGNEAPFIAAYQERLRQLRAVDLQDITRDALLGMRTGTVRRLPVSHLLADEWQDVDTNQLMWVLEHHNQGVITGVVGDDDQSIYGWRNSLGFEAFQAFKAHVSPTVVELSHNYRSSQEIIDAATALVHHNVKRIPKVILATRGTGGHIAVANTSSKKAEAEYLLDMMSDDISTDDDGEVLIPQGRWGVLARNNADLWLVGARLRSARIPYTRSSKKDEYPFEIIAFCALLRALQTGDQVNLETALRAVGLAPSTITELSRRHGDQLFSIMDGEVPDVSFAPVEQAKALQSFAAVCRNWRRSTAEGRYRAVVDAVALWFQSNVVSAEQTDDFLNFTEILKRGPGTLNAKVNHILQQQTRKHKSGVHLLTMHGSKGMEFDRVFILQCNAGVTPSKHATSIEEERRLFYVAMTRARFELTLSYNPAKLASQFIAEAGCAGATATAEVAATDSGS
jgi:DNA helicase-2/ATP-dependent DNA helicase PcrA